MTVIRRLLLLLLFIQSTFSAIGQHYNFKKFTTKNGLSNSIVQKIIQDKDGYLWFATQSGLSKFDGKNFKNYFTSNGLNSNVISTVLQDSKGILWIGTTNGLCKFDGLSFQKIDVKGLNAIIYSILEDKQHELWFTTYGNGLFHYDGKNFHQITRNDGLPTDSLLSVYQDSKDNIWVGTYHGGACKIARNAIETRPLQLITYNKNNGLSSNNIFCMLEYKPGVMWLGSTNGGVSVIEANKISQLIIPGAETSDYISSLFKDSRGNYWIGTWEHGLFRYSEKGFVSYSEKNGLLSGLINSIFEDREGNIWIGSDLGLNLFRNDAFIGIRETDGLPSKLIQSFEKINDETLLIGTASGLCTWDNKKLLHITDIPDLVNASILAIAKDSAARYWIGTFDGIYICSYDKKFRLERKIAEANRFFTYPVSSILHVAKNKTYVATYGNGLFLFENNNSKHYGADEGLMHQSINNLFEDKAGNIWIATLEGGAYKLNNETFTQFTQKQGLPENNINCIAQDKKGNLLFGTTENGLSLYDGKRFHHFNENQGLLSNLVYSIKVDKQNCIWLGTNKGLNKIKLTDYFEIDYSKTYNDQNGLEGNELLNNSLFFDANNIVWVGTTEGFSRFDVSLDFPNTTPPCLVLQEIRLAYQKVNWKNYSDQIDPKTLLPTELKLNYKNNHLTFFFQALTTDENVKYRYMLDGLENRWSPATSATEAVYANIPSGRDYVFRVQAMNKDGIWSENNIAYKFTINSPIWQRWWFIALSIIAAITLLILIFNYRTKRLAQEKKILEEKVEARTLELRDTNSKLNVAFTDIKDSINYAQRIQQAILPLESKIKDAIPDTFLLFKPRDVVSGDFYWFGTVVKNNQTHHIIAAADCTGHGVPGAFMSMIGNTILNEIVITKEIIHPSEILSQLHQGVRSALKQNQNTSRDGMDICLCSINEQTKEVHYAGAFNPLWIMRNDKSVEVIKATKSAIGGFTAENQVFESHKVQLHPGEAIYLFTDGYADQFGGKDGKKLTTKKFRDTLVSLHNKSMSEQGFYLNNFIEIWRGNEFQVDDILVIGIRL